MGIFETIFAAPIYNLFILILGFVNNNIFLFLIVTPIVLSIITFPLILQSTKVGILQKYAKPEIDKIREKYKDNTQEQGKQLLELYKRKGIKPFSSIFSLIISLIIIITSSLIIIKGEIFDIRLDLLYSFNQAPEFINSIIFNIDLVEKSILLSFIAGISQYFLINNTMKASTEDTPELKAIKDKIKGVFIFAFPVITAGSSFFFSGAVALYWAATAVVALIREIFIMKPLKEKWNKTIS